MKKILFYAFVTILFSAQIACKKENVDNPLDKTRPFEMPCDYLSTDRVLKNDPDKPIDYVVNCVMNIDARITIEPGTVIQFKDETGWAVYSGGSLNAIGTVGEPILFTGKTRTRGSWNGLYIESTNVNNRLEHCIIEYAGGGAFNSNDDKGGLILYASSRITMNEVLIRNCDNYGINASYGNTQLAIRNCQIRNCKEAPVLATFDKLDIFDNTCDFRGNDNDYVAAYAGEMNANLNLKKLSVPYFFKARPFGLGFIAKNGTLRLDPGVQLIMDDQTLLVVSPTGGLNAVGTVGDPILFTGRTKSAGSWAGIYVDRSTNASNLIDNAIIEYAGDGTDDGKGAVSLWSTPHLTIQNTLFRFINRCAVYSWNGSSNPNLTLSNNTLTNVSGAELCWD